MEEPKDVKIEETAAPSPAEKPAEEQPSTQDVKPEPKPDSEQSKPKEEEIPWGKDPRFKKFLEDKKILEERSEAMSELSKDPDFAAFLALKRQKEAMAAEEKNVDFSKMTAEEYAKYVAEQSKEAARTEYQNLVEANKRGDELSQDAVRFAETCGVDKATFEKEFAPQIIAYYGEVAKKVGEIDKFVVAHPPKEVFKSIFFDKAGEIGVKQYKEKVDKARKAGFEAEGKPRDEKLPEDPKSRFEALWRQAYGNAESVPQSAFGKNKG